MKRKNVITKALSWLLVTSMVVTGSTVGTGVTVSASTDVTQEAQELDITPDTVEDDAKEAIVVVKSPVVDETNRSITFNLNAVSGTYAAAKEVLLRGDIIDDWNVGRAMTKQGNAFTITVNDVNPGVYTYKYVVDGTWITDPHNKQTVSTAEGANSVVYVPGLSAPSGTISVMQGKAKELPATLKYYDNAGNYENVAVTYSLPEAYQTDAVLNGNSITVNKEAGSTVEVIATYQSGNVTDTATVKLTVAEAVYTYNIYYYDFESTRMATNASQLWMWEPNVTNGVAYDFTETTDINGNKWLKASYELSCKDLAIIARSYGGWTWQNSSKGMVYHNTDGADEVNLYIVSSSKTIYTDVPDLETLKPRERYVIIEYERAAADYAGWNVYTWNSGYQTKIELEDAGNKKVAKIKVSDSPVDLNLGFIMRRSDATSDWLEKDGGDNYLVMPTDQTVLKAQFIQGKGVVSTTPDNVGYEMDGENKTVHFYYRDDAKYLNYDLASLENQVSVSINGTVYPMTYNSTEERFCYDVTNITDGDVYQYYYLVNGTKVLDKFNDKIVSASGGEQCNECTYHDYDMTISAALSQSTIDYNQNSVLTINTNFAGDNKEFEVKDIICDLSALGCSADFSIEPELMEGTIAVTDTTAAGSYTLPVVLTDIYGNKYDTSVNVTVKERVKANGDFDWDEAVVYFAVTDRFFDGDVSNNDAYGVGDYNTSTATTVDGGGSSYHGGDFAGLTQKLDYLQDLGVNTIWITPIVENITQDLSSTEGLSAYGYHGYWASDFTKLNKHLGTEEQFKALLDAAHARGMKLMVDVVVNHAGYDTESYFNTIIKDSEGNYISMVRDDSNTVDGDTVKDGLSGLPDFVTENAAVRNQLVQWQVDWMTKYDIDYYRVDTVKHVEHTTWAAFKNALTKANPEFKMIGEYAGGGYAASGGELSTGSMDALLDFDFNDFAQRFVTGDMTAVEASLVDRNGKMNNTATLGSFLGSHDEDGFLYRLCSDDDETGSGLSEEQAKKLYKVAVTLQLTAKGMPVIYYNEEIGLTGEDNYPYQTNRQDFDWSEAEKQTYEADSIYNHYKTLLAIRNQYTSVFAKGTRNTISTSNENGYVLTSRSYAGETLYIGFNISDADRTVAFQTKAGAVYRDLYNNKTYTADANGTINLVIPSVSNGGTAILAKSVEAESITAANTTATVKVGESVKLNAAVAPANTTTNVVWNSSDTNVAVVSKYGMVKGIAAGTAKITATLGDDSGKMVEFTITVEKTSTQPGDVPPSNPSSGDTDSGDKTPESPKDVKVTKVTISGPSKKLAAGKKVKLTAKVTPSNATNTAVTWKSSNKKYATVDAKGNVTLKKAGIGKYVTITATAKDGSNKKASYKIKIMKHAVKSIKLSASKKAVKAGKTLKVKANVKTTGKTVNKTLNWSSSNTKYATVSSTGVVKAKKAGKGKTVTITATSTDGTNKKAKIKIKIK